MKSLTQSLSHVAVLTIAVTGFSSTLAAQTVGRRPLQITVSEDVLAAFVDEPCHHFEQARKQFLERNQSAAADELRTAAAFLKLESARATPHGKSLIEISIRELEQLATSIERGRVESVRSLEQAFARAHFSLAEHHCVKSAHRCCRPATFSDKQKLKRAGHDLKAASVHLRRGKYWGGGELDEATQKILAEAERSAGGLIENGHGSQSGVTRSIHSVHRRLEAFTGRKISIAPPMAVDDNLGPRIFE